MSFQDISEGVPDFCLAIVVAASPIEVRGCENCGAFGNVVLIDFMVIMQGLSRVGPSVLATLAELTRSTPAKSSSPGIKILTEANLPGNQIRA